MGASGPRTVGTFLCVVLVLGYTIGLDKGLLAGTDALGGADLGLFCVGRSGFCEMGGSTPCCF